VKKKKILLLGASSSLGKIFLRESNLNEIQGTYNKNKVGKSIFFDSIRSDISQLRIVWDNFSHAIILIGDTDPNSCIKDPELSNKLNILSIKRIIDFLSSKNIFIIFTSSEFVFDGKSGLYSESDSAEPILLYGKQKLQIENYLEKIDNHCILRLAKMYDDFDDSTLFLNWKNSIKENKVINCANDQFFSPLYTNDVVKITKIIVENNVSGLFHLSCGKRFRRDELLEVFCKTLKVKPEINLCSINDFNLPEERPLDVSLNSNKITRLLDIKFTDTESYIKKHFTEK
tara:strand:- start:377 stop:1237 length:861 start_codon:yes stop_codon:yes gene_type:complete